MHNYIRSKQENSKLKALSELRKFDRDFEFLQNKYGIFVVFNTDKGVYTGRTSKDGIQREVTYDCVNNVEVSNKLVTKEQLAQEEAKSREEWAKRSAKYTIETKGHLTFATHENGTMSVFGANKN